MKILKNRRKKIVKGDEPAYIPPARLSLSPMPTVKLSGPSHLFNVMDGQGLLWTVYGSAQIDGEPKFLMYRDSWIWVEAKDYTPINGYVARGDVE